MSAIRALSTSGTLADDDCLPLMTRKLDSEVFSDSFRRVLRVRLIRLIASSDYTIQRRRRRAVTGESKKGPKLALRAMGEGHHLAQTLRASAVGPTVYAPQES